ncbi:hypothetical protein [Streptomyces olivoreticuli]|uniref:hypothetical protein n=1 Tax=Streptomyces olivoreticuli TaxID=68246 RepID=UPI000E234391|nr:hypothetical protein [Streptomyces olivoreticuli]
MDVTYPYDRELYSRLFLNCSQRQSLVMLAEREPLAYQLLHRCMVSTDEILRQIVREQRPKYSFESGLLHRDDLANIGIVAEEAAFDTYAEARGLLLDVVAQEGYAILVGDVFYWPHCPEYTNQHLMHTIVLKGYDEDTARWSLIDDNPASLLCAYTYPEEVIAAGFDNNELRRVRYFTTKDFDASQAAAASRGAFAGQLDRYEDGLTLFSGVGELIACPWIAPERVVFLLHDAFSLYQGSRAGLLEYVRRTLDDARAEELLTSIVRQSADVRNQLLLGKVTGSLDADRTAAACLVLKEAEEELLPRLRAAAGERA